MRHYTDKTWPGAIDADGHDVVVAVAADARYRDYILFGDAAGSIIVEGAGAGNARRHDDGAGDAFRIGFGYGDAFRCGTGNGSAHHIGVGRGDACRTGSGAGDACHTGGGSGFAFNNSSGNGCEVDAKGRRVGIGDQAGIKYVCTYGDGCLRVGCEVHELSDWIENAELIDGGHNDGIAALTRALAMELQAKRGAS